MQSLSEFFRRSYWLPGIVTGVILLVLEKHYDSILKGLLFLLKKTSQGMLLRVPLWGPSLVLVSGAILVFVWWKRTKKEIRKLKDEKVRLQLERDELAVAYDEKVDEMKARNARSEAKIAEAHRQMRLAQKGRKWMR